MKYFTAIASLLLFTATAFAQDYTVPEDYSFEVAEDYAPMEGEVIKAIEYLENSPVTKDAKNRKEVNKFVLMYMMGSPDVSIELDAKIADFADCADCMMLFMAGWTKFSLQNAGEVTKLDCVEAAIKTTVAFYNKNKDALGKNKVLEKYNKLIKKGTLRSELKSMM